MYPLVLDKNDTLKYSNFSLGNCIVPIINLMIGIKILLIMIVDSKLENVT